MLTQDYIKSFVLPAHGDLPTVKAMLEKDPDLLNAMYEVWQETALGAASHVGNRPIAEYLLEQGAPLTICTAAMLGRKEEVKKFLEADPSLATAKGAHGITVLFHTALSGDTEIADLLLHYGGGEGAGHALHAAISKGHVSMVKWLLDHNADFTAQDFQGKTALQAALQKEHHEIVALLEAAGAKE